MKKITLNETDLLRIVKKVLNEQYDEQLDEDQIEFLHAVFARELKPPFRRGDEILFNKYYSYYNRNNEWIGWLNSKNNFFEINDSFYDDIDEKVCTFFEFARDTWDWWSVISPYLTSWLEDQINIEFEGLGTYYIT